LPAHDEREQAGYLRQVYMGVLGDPELKANVAHIFWFKYEDFVPGNYSHNYGLVRLKETDDGTKYHPSGAVAVRKLAYRTYQEIALGYTLTEPFDPQLAASQGLLYFEETKQAIAPHFAAYWELNGGIERFGYPISRPIPLRGYLSQFFERAVFEWHPQNAGTPTRCCCACWATSTLAADSSNGPTPARWLQTASTSPRRGTAWAGSFCNTGWKEGACPCTAIRSLRR
jgi:hypothetical protein